MEIGVSSFADIQSSASDLGRAAHERLRNLMEEIELADQIGLDVIGIGEHHRPDFAVSAPAVVLAAAAVKTKNIRLTSTVTVLSSDDPVRVFEEFATVDLLSNGRAEIMAGRGSFIESFPLFGYDLNDYDELFSEKLELLMKIRDRERVTWKGEHRAALENLGVYPRPLQEKLPIWVAVGGTPQSASRAGTLGLPMALAIIGGMPERFTPFVKLFRDAARRAGHQGLPLAINSHTYVAETSQQARDEYFPSYSKMMNAIGRERGWQPMQRADFDALCGPRGALLVGSPQEVIDKIMFEHELFKHDRFLAQVSVGPLPHKNVLRAIELLGNEVAPQVRKLTSAVAVMK